ncbi:MAG: transglycosylase SLT domain-containing protein [Pseudomonadota bacterium]|nr:transglycosylase SLT domain-containing protein [Pseudomonadota bacterium]
MKGIRGLLVVFCALAALPAGEVLAGTVYRCDSANGGRSYSSKRVSGASCTPISSYSAKRYKSPAPASWMTSPPAGAVGSVTAPTPVAGSPASVNANPPASFSTPTEVTPAPAAAKPSYQAPRLVRGQVYSYIKDGIRHYSSRVPKGVSGATAMRTIKYSFLETCYACGSKPGVNFGTLRLNLTAYNNEIASAARAHGVDEAIVRAIIHAESAFNPNALSRVGAQGLMQLMPGTARDVGVSNAFDPAQNIGGGVRYLAMLLKRYNGNLTLAAAGYNAGPGAVDKYKGVPPYSETRRYVERVGVLADRYRGSLAAK